jgi:hypothetical protein
MNNSFQVLLNIAGVLFQTATNTCTSTTGSYAASRAATCCSMTSRNLWIIISTYCLRLKLLLKLLLYSCLFCHSGRIWFWDCYLDRVFVLIECGWSWSLWSTARCSSIHKIPIVFVLKEVHFTFDWRWYRLCSSPLCRSTILTGRNHLQVSRWFFTEQIRLLVCVLGRMRCLGLCRGLLCLLYWMIVMRFIFSCSRMISVRIVLWSKINLHMTFYL